MYAIGIRCYFLWDLFSCGLLNVIKSDNVSHEQVFQTFGPSPTTSDKWTTSDRNGIWSLVSLHPIAPGPVLDLSYEEDTDTSVNITWKSPKEPNGDIVAYFVEHGVYNKESTTEVRVDPSRPRYTVIQVLGKDC